MSSTWYAVEKHDPQPYWQESYKRLALFRDEYDAQTFVRAITSRGWTVRIEKITLEPQLS
jgi:hypothetical protein